MTAGDVTTPAELAGQAYISSVRSKAKQLKTALINQTLNDLESWRKAVDTQWGYDHPNWNPTVGRPPTTSQEYEKYRSTVQNGYYDWVEPTFERYLKPDPDATNAMIDALGSIENNFQGNADSSGGFRQTSPGLARITDAMIDMDHWQGVLQENFIDNFLSPLQTVSHNEAIVAQVARELLQLNKINYIRYRKAVLNLLDRSIQATNQLNNGKDPKSVMWGTLIVASIGTVLSAGSGLVLAIGTGISVVATLAGGLVPDPPQTNDLSAPTAQEVAVNVSDALTKLDTDAQTGDDRVAHAFNDVYQKISEMRSTHVNANSTGPLNVARPNLDNASKNQVLTGFTPNG